MQARLHDCKAWPPRTCCDSRTIRCALLAAKVPSSSRGSGAGTRIANGQHFVDDRISVRCAATANASRTSFEEYRLTGVRELFNLGKGDDVVEFEAISRRFMPRIDPLRRCFRDHSARVEPGSHLKSDATRPRMTARPSVGSVIHEDFQQRALSRAVAPDDADNLAGPTVKLISRSAKALKRPFCPEAPKSTNGAAAAELSASRKSRSRQCMGEVIDLAQSFDADREVGVRHPQIGVSLRRGRTGRTRESGVPRSSRWSRYPSSKELQGAPNEIRR